MDEAMTRNAFSAQRVQSRVSPALSTLPTKLLQLRFTPFPGNFAPGKG
jgi:hypothetical protein